MKRVINGHALNTSCSFLLCTQDHADGCTGLYQTQGGLFFLAGEGKSWGQSAQGMALIDDSTAKAFLTECGKGDLASLLWDNEKAIRRSDGRSLVGIRLPPALKFLCDQAATVDGMNLNDWVLTKLEDVIHNQQMLGS